MKFRMEMLSACGKCSSRTSVSEKTRRVSLLSFSFILSAEQLARSGYADRTEFSSPVDKSDIDVTIEISRLSPRRFATATCSDDEIGILLRETAMDPTGFETSVKMSPLI